jgi:DNA-binding NarL/FixJ family response regulator
MSAPPLRVMLVDDHQVVRDGIKLLLADTPDEEERVLGLVAEGRINGQIAAQLGLAEKTVKNYVSAILAKLEVARRAEAGAYLARHTTLPGN